jgi:hypothetical protein
MIIPAKRIAKGEHSLAEFRVDEIKAIQKESAQVVSAASLLAVLPDREAGLNGLWQIARPGGALLVIEPTGLMNVENAARVIKNGLPKKEGDWSAHVGNGTAGQYC